MLNTRLIAELIEEARLTEIKDAMEKSLAPGSVTFDQALARLVRAGQVAKDDALANADSPTNLLWNLENTGSADAPIPAKKAVQPASEARAMLAGEEDPADALRGSKADDDAGDASFSDFLLNV